MNSHSLILKKTALVKQASGALKRCVTRNMCRAYLASIVLWLYAGDAKAAWQEFQTDLETSGDEFGESDEAQAAAELFDACRSGEAEAVEAVVKKWACFARLEGGISPLALRLSNEGDVGRLAVQLAMCEQS